MKKCSAANPATCRYHGYSSKIESTLNPLVGKTIKLPNQGLSGHSIGSYMENYVEVNLTPAFPNLAKSHIFLNKMLMANLELSSQERGELFPDIASKVLFGGSDSVLSKWSQEKQFKSKQDATADLIYIDYDDEGKPFVRAFDVKSTQSQNNKTGQPPNIISAGKLYTMSDNILNSGEPPRFSINYIGINWEIDKNNSNNGIIKKIRIIDLFKIPPTEMYINWTAANQVQFSIEKVSQAYKKSPKEWAKEFQEFYLSSELSFLTKKIVMNKNRREKIKSRI